MTDANELTELLRELRPLAAAEATKQARTNAALKKRGMAKMQSRDKIELLDRIDAALSN